MSTRGRAVLCITLVLAASVFAVVQDRITAAGARRYVALQREAIGGPAPLVTIDEVMSPAVERSVRQGLLWATAVLAAGVGIAVIASRRPRGDRRE